MENSDILLHFVSGIASGITRRVIDEILTRFNTKETSNKSSRKKRK